MATTHRVAAAASNKEQRSSSTNIMNSSVSAEYRRKPSSLGFDDEGNHISTAAQTAVLLERESFTLDDDHSMQKDVSNSLMELSPQDRRNYSLLVLLYLLHEGACVRTEPDEGY